MGRATGHFTRFNASVDNGWLAVLTRNEQAVLTAYRRFADHDGLANPSGMKIADLIGHKKQGHLSRIRKKLAEYGLIEIVSSGGGRGNAPLIKLLDPPPAKSRRINLPKPPQNGSSETSPNLPNLNNKPPQTGAINLPKPAHKPPQTGDFHNKENSLIQQLNTTASNSAGGTGEAGIEDEAGVLAILEVGESDPKAAIRRLHDTGHLTGWELSGLSEGMSSAELRFLLAKYFLNLRAMGKEPTRISWRSRIGEISRMDPGEAAERLRNTIANNYVGLARASPKNREETPDEFARRIISSREQNQ